MAVIPINMARVSQNLRTFNLLETVRRNQAGLLTVQNQLATGLRVTRPSDDPLSAAAASSIDRQLDQVKQLERSLLNANNIMMQNEAAMLDAVNLLMDAESIALQSVGDTISADERSSLAPVIDSTLEQLVAIGNRQYLDTYLFAGHYNDQPFEWTADGIIYHGDTGRASTIVSTDLAEDHFKYSGAELFAGVSTAVRGVVDLNPALTSQTRISDLRGTAGNGVTLGRIVVSDGNSQVEIDLSAADTVGDLIDKLNAEMPASLQAVLGTQNITIGSAIGAPVSITISDIAGGHTARDLGLTASGLALAGGAADLDPRLTLQTNLADLAGGTGLDTTNSFTIRNGSYSATPDFANAQTVEDLLNAINQTDVGVWARIADDGNSIEILNRVSGTDLTIEENNGQLATALGIRSLHADTALADLNNGRGVETLEGNDIRIITADDTSIEIDIDGAVTLQDVISLLNTQGGGAITATFVSQGNGLMITDNTSGPGTFRAERVNLSPALGSLGLDVPATGDTLIGRDINPIRNNNGFTALLELRGGLRGDDTRLLTRAGQRLNQTLKTLREMQGNVAAHAQAMEKRGTLMENEVTAAHVLLSDTRDVDLSEAIVRFQQMQTALQANLNTAARVMNLSLLDFL
ncbi:MAG: hypothetical protein ABIG44_10715 [Planctomycetota bacterium]